MAWALLSPGSARCASGYNDRPVAPRSAIDAHLALRDRFPRTRSGVFLPPPDQDSNMTVATTSGSAFTTTVSGAPSGVRAYTLGEGLLPLVVEPVEEGI